MPTNLRVGCHGVRSATVRCGPDVLGHGHAHLEASSNAYLEGDFRLGESEEQTLTTLGFRHTDTLGDDR